MSAGVIPDVWHRICAAAKAIERATRPLSHDLDVELDSVRQFIDERSDAEVGPCESPWPGNEPFLCTRPTNHPGEHVAHNGDDQPVGSWPQTSSAGRKRHSQTPGEVSGDSPTAPPSPGDLRDEQVVKCNNPACPCQADDRYKEPDQIADSELLAGAAAAVDLAARRAPTVVEKNALLNLADTLRDRAAQFAALESLDTQ